MGGSGTGRRKQEIVHKEHSTKVLTKEEKALLFSKIRHRRYEAVQQLLESGVSCETRDEFGNTLVMLAAQTGLKPEPRSPTHYSKLWP